MDMEAIPGAGGVDSKEIHSGKQGGDKVIKKEETNTVNIENPSPGADRSTAFLSANSVQKSANNVKEEKQDKQSTSKRNVA